MAYSLVDVSGPSGSAGKNGVNAPISSAAWGNGSDGGDAGNPTIGGNGGVIDLTVSHTSKWHDVSYIAVKISGTFNPPSHPTQHLDKIFKCDSIDSFLLDARGGRGGDGGIGGNGQNGARGHAGMSATRYTPATNGGRGGNGGDAGAGTSGANGGLGGTIILRLTDSDAGLLLMFIKSWTPDIIYSLNVKGGNGGRAGQHGVPGAGGPGGPGGAGCTWSETTHHGNGSSSTRTYSKPGGYPGPSGFNGHRPTHRLHNGTSGADGYFEFLIQDGITGQVTRYNQIFDLRLHQANTHSSTGVFEPEARIIVDTLTLHNLSTMPTPRRDIRITIDNNVWISNQNQSNILPQLVAPHTSLKVNCTQPFAYLIKPHNVDTPGPALRATDVLRFTATMTVLERWLPAFDIDGQSIKISYPIELSRISHMNSMVTGQVAAVCWKVSNTSKVDFGTFSANGRIIRVTVRKKSGEVSSSALKFSLKSTQKGTDTVPPEQTIERDYVFEIPFLKAGESLQLEAKLTLGEAELYEAAEFWVYLELGKIHSPSSPKVVHIQSFDVRVSTTYRGFPAGFSPDVLLVTNHKTLRSEYQAWVHLLKKQLGLSLFVWDLSQMGHFDLTRSIPTLFSIEPTTLIKDLAGKTMFILNNKFQYGDEGLEVTAQTFVLNHQLLRAVYEYDNRFYVITPHVAKDGCAAALDHLMQTPIDIWKDPKFKFNRVRDYTKILARKDNSNPEDNDNENTHDDDTDSDVEENLKSVLSEPVMACSELSAIDPSKFLDDVVEVQIKARLFRNIKIRMEKKAGKVEKKLRRLRPHIHHLVLYEWHAARKPLFRTMKNRGIKTGGTILIVPSLKTTKRRIVFTTAASTENPRLFVESAENLRGVIGGLGIDVHFRLLERVFITGPIDDDAEADDVGLFCSGGNRIITEDERKLAEVLQQQLVYDIAVEVSTICDGIGDNSSLEDSQILEMMENLRQLVWKVESLSNSNTFPEEKKVKQLLVPIAEDDEGLQSALNDLELQDQMQTGTEAIFGEIMRNADSLPNTYSQAGPSTTIVGEPSRLDAGEIEAIFYMFPVKYDSPLGEWMMDMLAQLYAFIKSLRAGLHQRILPNRRTARVQKQAMDLLHRIGDASIIDFADPRSKAKLKSLQQQKPVTVDQEKSFEYLNSNQAFGTMSNIQELPTYNTTPNTIWDGFQDRTLNTPLFKSDSQTTMYPSDYFTYPANDISKPITPMSLASGLSFTSAMTSATRMSSASFSIQGTSASRSRITYKKLDPQRRRTIESFKGEVKLHLRKLIRKHYKNWEKGAKYQIGGFLDPSKKALRQHIMEVVIFKPSESLVDNTFYGRYAPEVGRKEKPFGGVQNTVITNEEYTNRKVREINRIRRLESIITAFLAFQNTMLQESVIV